MVLNLKDLINRFLPTSQWLKHSNGYKINPCPFCNHNDCFDITADLTQYQCFSCKQKGNYHTLAKHLGTTAFVNPNNPQRPPHSIINRIEYIYTDELGSPIYRVVRTIPKGFYQEYFDGKNWKSGTASLPPLLYNLPKILHAVKTGEPVHIFEGEKDVENATKYLNIVATTNSGGSCNNIKTDSKKWSDEMTEQLRGSHLIIIPDNDEPGRIHTNYLCSKLYKIAKSIKIIQLPNLPQKGDLTDWIIQGGTKEQFQTIISQTKPFTSYYYETWNDIMASELPIRNWVIPGILKECTAMMLVGKPKLGKSWLALEWAIAKATGGYSLGRHKLEKARCLYIAYEDSTYTIQERAKMLQCMNEDIPNLHIMYQTERIEPDQGIKELNDFLDDHPDTKLVILDTYAYCKPKRGRNDDIVDFDASVGRTLVKIANKYNCGIILIHHSGKATRDDVHDETIGTTGLRGSFSGSIQMKQIRETPEVKDFILHIEGREIRGGKWQIKYEKSTHWLYLISEAAEVHQQTEGRSEIIEILKKSSTPLSSKTISEQIGKTPDNVRKTLDRLEELGIVNKAGKKGKANLYQMAIKDYSEQDQSQEMFLKPIIGQNNINQENRNSNDTIYTKYSDSSLSLSLSHNGVEYIDSPIESDRYCVNRNNIGLIGVSDLNPVPALTTEESEYNSDIYDKQSDSKNKFSEQDLDDLKFAIKDLPDKKMQSELRSIYNSWIKTKNIPKQYVLNKFIQNINLTDPEISLIKNLQPINP